MAVSLKLNSEGDYILVDRVGGLKVASIAKEVESRGLGHACAFKLHVGGGRVIGHTLADPHGRLAFEFEATPGWDEGEEEEIHAIAPIKREWKTKPSQALRPVTRKAKKSWWKFW